jgi:hypothetical protein
MDGIDLRDARFGTGSTRDRQRRLIPVPYRISNLTFGGALKIRHFMGAAHMLHAIFSNRRGVSST